MVIQKRRFSLSYLLLFVIVFGCNKEKTSDYYIDNAFKEWVLFQQGSYWVYLENNSNLRDSTYINKQPTSFLSGEVNRREHIDYSVNSSFLKGLVITRELDYSFAMYEFYYPNDNYFQALNSGYTSGAYSGPTRYCVLIEKIDTMTLNNIKYANIIHTRSTYIMYDNMQNDCYFVKNIGLIKFRKRSDSFDSTWSILRWHVIQ